MVCSTLKPFVRQLDNPGREAVKVFPEGGMRSDVFLGLQTLLPKRCA